MKWIAFKLDLTILFPLQIILTPEKDVLAYSASCFHPKINDFVLVHYASFLADNLAGCLEIDGKCI